MKKLFNRIQKIIGLFFGLFSETNPASMIRFLSFCMFIIATDITYRIVSSRVQPLGQWDFYTIIGLYCLAFFPKVIQKFMERGVMQTSMYDTSFITPPAAETVNYQNLNP